MGCCNPWGPGRTPLTVCALVLLLAAAGPVTCQLLSSQPPSAQPEGQGISHSTNTSSTDPSRARVPHLPLLSTFINAITADLPLLWPGSTSGEGSTPPGDLGASEDVRMLQGVMAEAQSWAGQGLLGLRTATPVLSDLVAMCEEVLHIKQGFLSVYSSYWNATYHQYLGAAEKIAAQLGLGFGSAASSAESRVNIDIDVGGAAGGLIPEVAQRFREVTGTVCRPPAFIPPSQQPTTLIGRGVQFSLSAGGCTLTRVATQTRRDLVVRCTLPQAQLATTQPRYAASYVAPATFTGKVCKRERRFGSESTTTIDLWNPGEFGKLWTGTPPAGMQSASRNPASSLGSVWAGAGLGIGKGSLGGSTVDEELSLNTSPFQEAYQQRVQAVLQVLREIRADFAAFNGTLVKIPDPAALHDRLRIKLAAAGLHAKLTQASTSAVNGRSSTDAGRSQASRLQQLAQLFQDLQSTLPGLGSQDGGAAGSQQQGVQHMYDQVLHQGLLATLYHGGQVKGPTTTQPPNVTQPAVNASESKITQMAQSDAGGTSSARLNVSNASSVSRPEQDLLPANIFSQLEGEMRRMIAASSSSSFARSVQQPVTGRAVRGTGLGLEPATKTIAAAGQRAVMAAAQVLLAAP